jgi:hypothetical protein
MGEQTKIRVTNRPETVTARALVGGWLGWWWSAFRLTCTVTLEAVQAQCQPSLRDTVRPWLLMGTAA